MGTSGKNTFMFSIECDEPEGKIIREVHRVELTPHYLSDLWDKAKKFKSFMGIEIPTEQQFIDFFIFRIGNEFKAKGLLARIDNVGIFYLTDLQMNALPFEASIHYTFFDRRHKGRIPLCRRAIEYVFDTYGFNRLWTKVPVYIKPTMEYVEDIGFKREGRLRQHSMYKGQLFDTTLYGLTKDEVASKEAWIRGDETKQRRIERQRNGFQSRLQPSN